MHILEATAHNWMMIDPYIQGQKCRPMTLVSGNIRYRAYADTRGASSWWGPQMRVRCRRLQFLAIWLAILLRKLIRIRPAILYDDVLPLVAVLMSSRKVLSSKILEDQFLSPCPCPGPWSSSPCPCAQTTSLCPCPRPCKFKSSKIFEGRVGYLCQHFVLGCWGSYDVTSVYGWYSDNSVFLEDLARAFIWDLVCCPRGKSFSSRTNFQVLVLGNQVLVLEAWLLVLVLVFESEVLDNNTALLACDRLQNEWPRMTLSGYFT